MNDLLVRVASCSTCGRPLSAKGYCVTCLVAIGLNDSEEETTAPPDFIFGDFEIERQGDGSLTELGRGAMGVTYRAVDRVLHRDVALKVIEAPQTGDAGWTIRERFLREARAAASLRHPNVANVFQFGVVADTSRCYYAMELVEGETLDARVRNDGPLKPELVLGIGIQVSLALIAAAAHGLVHRDLKPGNIMLSPNDNNPSKWDVKVIDFGLAKAVAGEGKEMELSRGTFSGTPAFASPEQVAGKPADARSDIYSLGVTLWFGLTGRTPFPGQSLDEMRTFHQDKVLPFEQLVARKIQRPIIHLLTTMLANNPAERPQSARELLALLHRCHASLAVLPRRRHLATMAALLVIFLAIGGVGLTSYVLRRQRVVPTQAVTVTASAPPGKSIAVLPFENLSADKENAYFASGVQDETLSALAKIADLKVISRTSVAQYESNKPRNIPEIGKALGVANVMEGSVQRMGKQVRVVAQLIDARTDTHLWGETYDRDLSDVFAVQEEIANQIAKQLRAKLSPEEKAAIAEPPTSDLKAYSLYQQATGTRRNRLDDPSLDVDKRIQMLKEAIERDPNFILAYYQLARIYINLYGDENNYSSDERVVHARLARETIDTALRLRPDRGEPHLAQAYYYFILMRLTEARRELDIARRLLPNDAEAIFLSARLCRYEHRWDDALVIARQAAELDPQNGYFIRWTAEAYWEMRRFREGESFVREAIARNPSDAAECNDLLAGAKLAEGDLDGALELSHSGTKQGGGTAQLYVAFYKRDYATALKMIETDPDNCGIPALLGLSELDPQPLIEALSYQARGDKEKAKSILRSCRAELDKSSSKAPRNEFYYTYTGVLDGSLGNKHDAIREARHAVEMCPIASDSVHGPGLALNLAKAYAWTGDDRAIDQLEILAQIPSPESYGDLNFNSRWDTLRANPRFEKLVASLKPNLVP